MSGDVAAILSAFDTLFYPFFSFLYLVFGSPSLAFAVYTFAMFIVFDYLSDRVKKKIFKKNLEMIKKWEEELKKWEETYTIAILTRKDDKELIKNITKIMNDISGKIFFARIAVNTTFLALLSPYVLWAYFRFTYIDKDLLIYPPISFVFLLLALYIGFLILLQKIGIIYSRRKEKKDL